MYIVVVIAGAIFMMNGAIDPSQLVAYLLYITTLINSIHRIVQFTEQFQSGMSGVERFFQVMDAPIEISDAPDAKDIGIVKGDVTFDHVSFKYNDDGIEVLSDIDLDVKAGENIALVGPSGGGKTTLCNLIPRFYDTTARLHPHRRQGHPYSDAEIPARPHRLCAAGRVPVLRLGV